MAGPIVHSPVRNAEIEDSALNQQSTQPNPINITSNDFFVNELRRISHQQAEEELFEDQCKNNSISLQNQ